MDEDIPENERVLKAAVDLYKEGGMVPQIPAADIAARAEVSPARAVTLLFAMEQDRTLAGRGLWFYQAGGGDPGSSRVYGLKPKD